MERLPSYQPDEATQAAWEAREGKMYVQTNERWSSAYYALSGVFAAVTLQGSPEGYLLTNQLTAPDTAAPVLQIPGTGSRDSAVIRVLDVDGCETLELNGSLYQDASSVSPHLLRAGVLVHHPPGADSPAGTGQARPPAVR